MNAMAHECHECIDAHHHLWNYRPEDYPWMGEGMEVLRRDYLPTDLEEVARSAGITGTVVVQARQTTEETEWLAELAAKSELIRGVVGWAPLVDPNVAADLERFSSLPKVKGVRHVLHDEPDPYYMCREDFHRGVSLLSHYGLRYDLLIFASHLPQTIEFVDRHPNQIFIVDHIAKPRIREGVLSPWRENLKELALRQNVYCKLSGLVTEARWSTWKEVDLKPYLDVAIEAFTPQRVMFGSDWPVLTLASGYGQWAQMVNNHIREFSPDEQRRILAGTAVEAYGL
ncbi:MAG TPA: amidohydrolase family protein [Terracidiphilus sp.]|jgi:L-fuconolactonase|nr:amidohydrolase family protein [Terracidiphilus sp.]